MRALAIPLALLLGAAVYIACSNAEPTALGDKEAAMTDRYVYLAPVGDCPDGFDQEKVTRSNASWDRNADRYLCTKTVKDDRVILVDNVVQRDEAASD